jgi:small subunit ribosomal protein S7
MPEDRAVPNTVRNVRNLKKFGVQKYVLDSAGFLNYFESKTCFGLLILIKMPRRGIIPKRVILPDPKFGDETVAKFINVVMKNGKKAVAERIVYGALDRVAERSKADPLELFNKALDNLRPIVEVKSRRVGGSNYQVPVEVRASRRTALAMRWLADASRKRGEKSMGLRLAGEILEAIESKGAAIKKREDVHRMAEANKAFSHFRW